MTQLFTSVDLASHLTSLGTMFLISGKEGERETSTAYFRSCGEASNEIICVRAV